MRQKNQLRLRAMADAVAAYEAEFGAISREELLAQERADRRSAVTVRGRPWRRKSRRAPRA